MPAESKGIGQYGTHGGNFAGKTLAGLQKKLPQACKTIRCIQPSDPQNLIGGQNRRTSAPPFTAGLLRTAFTFADLFSLPSPLLFCRHPPLQPRFLSLPRKGCLPFPKADLPKILP